MPRFLEKAEEEMLEAAIFYEDQSVGLGEKFLEEVEGCVEMLLDRPEIGVPAGEFRQFPLRKFPFNLVYAVEDNDLVFVSVAHQRRRPGYWAGRHGR